MPMPDGGDKGIWLPAASIKAPIKASMMSRQDGAGQGGNRVRRNKAKNKARKTRKKRVKADQMRFINGI